VELRSRVLEDLGSNPLPYWRDDLPRDPEFPLSLSMGVREAGSSKLVTGTSPRCARATQSP
jgi:hypothetical protein